MGLIDDLVSEPFTPAMAARAGLGRAELDAMVRHGRLQRLLRGVYVEAGIDLSTVLRARAVALRIGSHRIVVDRTAAWIHGAALGPGTLPLDFHAHRRRPATALAEEDVTDLGGVRCTSPLRTAVDVGRYLSPDSALPLLDGLLRAGAVSHTDLIRAGGSIEGTGAAQFRELVARADARSTDAVESVLRLRWLEAPLPTPSPGLVVDGARIALGLATQRFGVVLAGQVEDLERCRANGWRILVLHRERVLVSDPVFLIEYLEREFHQHLLGAAG
jgi:hypothetical protein